jgi:hypothetical protein
MANEDYLQPYLQAVSRFGGGFQSLLWASPKTQRARFEALARLCQIEGKTLLDAGCGRADFLEFLIGKNQTPSFYIGLEAVEVLAAVAESRHRDNAKIIRGDFVRDPLMLVQHADVIVFSGSLNTLGREEFYTTITTAWRSAGNELAFNFLCSPRLAAGQHLRWHDPAAVLQLAWSLSGQVESEDNYLDGDCTIIMRQE